MYHFGKAFEFWVPNMTFIIPFCRVGPYIYHKVNLTRESLLCDLIIGRHLIPLFPETPYILQVIVLSRDDLVYYLMIG